MFQVLVLAAPFRLSAQQEHQARTAGRFLRYVVEDLGTLDGPYAAYGAASRRYQQLHRHRASYTDQQSGGKSVISSDSVRSLGSSDARTVFDNRIAW
jgi:hypothetical protein